MNPHSAWIIFRKEFVDILRDRRTLLAMILLPVVMYPVVAVILLQAVRLEQHQQARDTYTIAIPDEEHRLWLEKLLGINNNPQARNKGETTINPASKVEVQKDLFDRSVTPDQFRLVVANGDLENVLQRREALLAVRCEPPPTREGLAAKATVHLVFDAAEGRSEFPKAEIQRAIGRENTLRADRQLGRVGLTRADLAPLRVEQTSIATPEKQGGALLGVVLPYFLVLMTITGAIYPAMDLTVGERERGTLETLMTAPIPNTEIMAGKFMAITAVSIISSLLNLASLFLTLVISIRSAVGLSAAQLNFAIPVMVLPAVLIVIVPLAMFAAALLLATCAFARSLKEAQIYITPVLCAALIPPMLVLSPAIRLTGIVTVLPVANVLVLLREVFVGNFDLSATIITFGSTCLYAATAIVAAAKLYGHEAVLFADAGNYRTLFMRRYFQPSDHPDPATALLLVTFLFPLVFYSQTVLVSAPLNAPRLVSVTCAVLLGGLLLPPLAMAWYTKRRFITTFALRSVNPRVLAGSGLLGIGTPLLALAAASWLMPPDALQMEERQMATLLYSLPWWTMFLVFAVLPAIAEEVLFRGWLLGSLHRHLSPVLAWIIVGLLFGLFHIDIYRIPVVTVLGILLSYVCWQSGSIYPAMVVHACHNATALLLGRYAGEMNFSLAPLAAATVGILLLVLGIRQIRAYPRIEDVYRTRASVAR